MTNNDNDNHNNNVLEKIGNNTKRNTKKPPANTREQNIISQSQVELNRVKVALKNFVTTTSNSQLNVTRTQVIKYHKLARDQLLKNNPEILTNMLKLETTSYPLQLIHIKLSNNFFNTFLPTQTAIAPGETVAKLFPVVPVHGTEIRDFIHDSILKITTKFDPNSKLPDSWKKYYQLSKLVSTIRNNAIAPWGSTPYQATDPIVVWSLQAYHNTILSTLKEENFSVKLSEQNDKIVIRYSVNNYYIEWTYDFPTTLNYALHFLRKLPPSFVNFSLAHISNINISNNNNHEISAKIVPMLTEGRSTAPVRKAMQETSFPPRFWQMNVLKQKAQNNKVNNFSGNFLNTKQSRIESFLGKVDDLFTLISNGQQAHLSQAEIKKIIDSFAINPHMYTLEAQDKAIKKITKPLQQANNNRLILLTNTNYNNQDKLILSFPMGASLIGVVELLTDHNNSRFGQVGIRDAKHRDSGTTIRFPYDNRPVLGSSLSITETKPQLEKYIKNEPFIPKKQAQGNLYNAVSVIAYFCIWFGTAPRGATFHNYWYNPGTPRTVTPVVLARQLRQYKQFTQNKIKYLISVLPKHFKLIPLLKAYCKLKDDDDAYSWFLRLDIL